MKKVFLFFAILIYAGLGLSACGGEDNDNNGADFYDVSADIADATALDKVSNETDASVEADMDEDIVEPDELATDEIATDPLEDYYWLEGTWKCKTIDGNPCEYEVEVTIIEWDETKGALVTGLQPMGGCFIKKNPENSEFVLSAEFPSGSWAEGTADKLTNFIKFTFHYTDGEIHELEYTKL